MATTAIGFTFRKALVRPLAPSFATNSLQSSPPKFPIDIATAIAQHDAYVSALRNVLKLSVTTLPCLPDHPDGVFVEDTAVVVGDVCALTRPGHYSRQGEVRSVESALRRISSDALIYTPPDDIKLDGGDVLRTSHNVFVGMSKRTNEAAVDYLRSVLPLPVHAVPLFSGEGAPLHLKSAMTICGPSSIVYADTECTRLAKDAITEVEGDIHWYPVSEERAANCVYANGRLLYPSGINKEDERMYKEFLVGLRQDGVQMAVPVNMGEAAKSDGALTCCSIIIP
mmetsp:Transcript_23163/g.52929  ORF Transcript_23163/g.52929 Transcript_23163/m.52929 type:complete len:283 (-) Transcript_23163:169-1017(-)|eukprot:CAMPEP_0113299132 /NCGR_PEP_ID=MMETSP0010_2-20120614/1292_1 /TAXON_ID=216773 ORGANISM="Corethron hystrix, Strain 308" /NCGR_SAMPLE_ID=MMETSP0010_2 /ASSEMBLY_ACC=CAM_ASM_000155 /LENGTH=282 /DNA_ID=CAMNT_0000152311 /DNA_START=134 /DNA_END=982 /DNA_ORIENTATION=- /assembly_acc=CAM_ASM_000155